jgi:type IV secretory pathway protease TraF
MDWSKMYVKIMIAISLAVLGLALFLPASEQYKILLQFLVSASAALILWRALRAKPDYLWAATFGSVAVLFNPIVPVPLPSRALFALKRRGRN